MNDMQLLLAANSGRNIQAALCHEDWVKLSPHLLVLTQNGHIHTGIKSDILQSFLEDIPVPHTSETTATVVDDAVILQMLSPKCGNDTTSQDYAESVFIPYTFKWLQQN